MPALEVGVQFEEFQLSVRATENSAGKRAATARLVVRVEAEDTTPPVLRVSPSDLGYVDEHASVGTVVTDANGVPLKFSVSDQDKEVSSLKPVNLYLIIGWELRVSRMEPFRSGPRGRTDGVGEYKAPGMRDSIRAQRGRARSALFYRVNTNIKSVFHIWHLFF